MSLVLLAAAAGCSPFEPAPRDLAPDSLPLSYSREKDSKAIGETGSRVPDRWWESFGSPELNGLVDEALGGSFSVREAWARLRQSQARIRETRAGLYPEVDVEGNASHRRNRSGGSDTDSRSDTFSLGPAASYEIDLWGGIQADVTAASLENLADRNDLEAAAMTVAAETTALWVDLVAAREEIAMLEKQVETNTILADHLELRFKKSLSSALDVLQQREVLAGTLAQFPPLETRIRQKANAIALLTGKAPGAMTEIRERHLCDIPPLPQAGIPADLLVNRPDIRAAGMRLMAADWDTAAARADRLPNLTLSGSLFYNDTGLGNLVEHWIWTLAGRLTGTVFDAGGSDAAVERSVHVVEEKLAAYERTVLTALNEVEDALVAERNQARWIESLEAELAAARLARDEARRRYINGLDNFIPFISELVNVQQLERQIIQQRAQLLAYRIALHRALGGGWTRELASQAPANDNTLPAGGAENSAGYRPGS